MPGRLPRELHGARAVRAAGTVRLCVKNTCSPKVCVFSLFLFLDFLESKGNSRGET